MTIDDFHINQKFFINGRGHEGSEYVVTGFWADGNGRKWMNVRDLNDRPLGSTGFCDVNIAAFSEREQIVTEGDLKRSIEQVEAAI